MMYTIIISFIFLFLAVLLLGVRIFFVKGGKFPNFHIGGSKALKNKGINCATTQDRQAQKVNRMNVSDMINELNEKY